MLTAPRFEILFEIEGLNCLEPLVVGNITFEGFEQAQKDALGELHPVQEHLLQLMVGGTVARIEVVAESSQEATAEACLRIDEALNELRVALAMDASRGIQMIEGRQRRGEHYQVRQVKEAGVGVGWELGSRAVVRDIGGEFRNMLAESLAELAPLSTERIRKKLRVRLQRAVQWIGSSMARTDYDDAVLDLCTALECFLASKADKRKGEAIATRSVLLHHQVEVLADRQKRTAMDRLKADS